MRFMMFIKHTENYKMEDVPQSLFQAMGECEVRPLEGMEEPK